MLLLTYTVILILVALCGANLNKFIELTHTRTQLIMSFVSGIMLGIAVFHLLPHAVYSSTASIDFIAGWLMAGLLGMFFLQRLFHFHHHEFEEDEHNNTKQVVTDSGSDTHCDVHTHALTKAGYGVFLGLVIHSLIDGVALASSIQADIAISGLSHGLPGLGVFLAIVLHKPLDALTLVIFMRQRQVAAIKQVLVLVAYAMICPLMAALLLTGLSSIELLNPQYISAALAFSAGIFLCIALSDLLPEIHFHNHDRFKMTVVLLLGVAASLGIKTIESEARHQHNQPAVVLNAPPATTMHQQAYSKYAIAS